MEMTLYEMQLIVQIASRADEMGIIITVDRLLLAMDLDTVHRTMGLKLDELLDAEENDFLHDIYGIQSNMNRATGTLSNNFVPRYAK